MINKIKLIISNKVILYLFSRYFTYFIQFITSILIAVKLGPYYFGIWGFILLLINYFQITNFGISNSINILLVQHKDNDAKVKNLISSAYILIGLLWFVVIAITTYYYFFGISFFDKYEVNNFFFAIAVIAMFAYINILLMTIYRVKNSLFEIAFYQSIIPIFVFFALFLAEKRTLLLFLLSAYIFGHIFSFILFTTRKLLPRGGTANLKDIKLIIKKGIYLFVYNISYYLIIVTIRTLISVFYTVEEFGFFTFSYTLANSILLFLEALAFVIFPKVIDKLNSNDSNHVEKTIKSIRENYVSLAHGLIYVAIVIFPVFLHFLPQYENTLQVLVLTSLVIVLYTNSFGYNSYLMARNYEKLIAKISFLGFVLNLVIALLLIKVFFVSYTFVIIATMITYYVYAILYVYFGKIKLKIKISSLNILQAAFPLNLLIPYICASFIILQEYYDFLFLPLLLYLFLNIKTIKTIYLTAKKIIYKPSIVNINS